MEIQDLPESIKQSKFLNKDQLLQLATEKEIPVVDPSFEDEVLKNIFQYYSLNPEDMEIELHRYAATLIDDKKVKEAWQVLLTLA